MHILLDKLLIFGLCILPLNLMDSSLFMVISMLTAIAATSLNNFFENKLPSVLCAGYVILCIARPGFCLFMPLIVYDCAGLDKWVLRFCWIAAIPTCIITYEETVPWIIILASAAAFILQLRTSSQQQTKTELYSAADDAKEQAGLFERKNRELMDKQDYEVRLATLAERNRIAREIHDNVGHLLTRSILQVSALSVAHGSDGELNEEINSVKNTLMEAMDSIRNSVHDLHDESADLRSQLMELIKQFSFCSVKMRYDVGDISGRITYCFIAIVREALSNIARHSNASETSVIVTEHPAFYQLIVEDNGTLKAEIRSYGIGIQNMTDRVAALSGVFKVDSSKGFRIFVSIPKNIEGSRSR